MKAGKYLAALAVPTMILVGIQWISIGRGPHLPSSESFRYELDRFMKVDPTLVRFEETGRVDLQSRDLGGLAIAGKGRVVITSGRELLILEIGEKEENGGIGEIVERIQLPGPASCVAAGREGRLYVGAGSQVYIVEPEGVLIHEPWELGERGYPTAITIHDENVYVADAGNRLVWKFSTAGQLVDLIGHGDRGSEGAGFIVPSPYFDASVDQNGDLWVVNPGRLRIERYNEAGERKQTWGRPSMEIDGFAGCCNPSHIALLPGGGLVTSEKGIPRVKVYNLDGTLASVVAGPDQFAPGTAGLDLAVDEAGNVLVLDPGMGMLRVFSPLGDSGEPGDV